MPTFITQGRYTPEAIRGMLSNPDEDRAASLAQLFAASGGKLLSYYMTFGDYDFVVDLTQRIGEMFSFRDLETAEIEFLGARIRVVTPRTLIRMKRETGRPQDQLDVARLRERFGIEDV